jgi:MoxR-like ATPase
MSPTRSTSGSSPSSSSAAGSSVAGFSSAGSAGSGADPVASGVAGLGPGSVVEVAESAGRVQRPPAEVRYADELARLRETDTAERPPGWALSVQAARRFVVGDSKLGVSRKFVGDPSLIDRALITLATSRGLMLVGEPGTAKSLLSEVIAAAVSGDSTLTIQGGAATTEDQIRYSWNYALLVADGPSPRSLVPAPLLRGMAEGRTVRFEEITRCPLEVQDCLLSPLSDRVLAIPELTGPDAMVFARDGFNIIATANTRDRGVNDMSSALKRRFNFETVFPIADFRTELALVEAEASALLQRSGVTAEPRRDVLEVLVTTFRELRTGETARGDSMDRLSAVMSTAEAVSVAHAVGLRGWFLRGEPGTAEDLVSCLAGTAAKDNPEDLAKLRRYLAQQVTWRSGEQWQALHNARHLLPG